MTSDAEKEAHTHTQTDARENKWEKICYKVSHMTHTHSHPRSKHSRPHTQDLISLKRKKKSFVL